jgi:SP family myo-inositol transporter-like MFS transporter 13
MLYTIPIMAVALLLASVFFNRRLNQAFWNCREKANDTGLTIPTGGILLNNPPEPYSPALASLVLVSMLLFVAGYALGSGNIPWQQGELFRLEVRGVGTSICTAVNW